MLFWTFLIQYAQNIVRFEFNTEKDVSDYQMEEVVKYWFNSMGDTFDASIIGSFNVDTNDADLGYFTQLAWARTYKIGKYILWYPIGDHYDLVQDVDGVSTGQDLEEVSL